MICSQYVSSHDSTVSLPTYYINSISNPLAFRKTSNLHGTQSCNVVQTATDEPDPSKLSLAERVKLFNKKITEERLPVAPGGGPATTGVVRKPRHARFKTQPVTTEEVESATAKRISPLAASLVKPPDADTLGGEILF